MQDFSLQLSLLFWLVCGIVGLGALFFAAFFGVASWLLMQRIRTRGLSRYLGHAMLLALFVLNVTGLWIYVSNDLCALISFRADRSGISWVNWTRRRAYKWEEVKSLTVKHNLKGGELLEIRVAKSAIETESFEIDASNVNNFAALVKSLEKSTQPFVKRLK